MNNSGDSQRTISKRSMRGVTSTLVPNLQISDETSSSATPSFLRSVQFAEKSEMDVKSYKQIVEEIVMQIVEERKGKFVDTSSECALQDLPKSETKIDRRLKYWQDVLAERRQMEHKIKVVTGKHAEEVLLNRRVTVEEPNKETVKRLLDYAQRMQRSSLNTKQLATLREYADPCTGVCIKQLPETWPQAERQGFKYVEIVGLPQLTKKELLGEGAAYDVRNTWLQSSVLDEQLVKRFRDISEVIEFFPDLDQLAINGRAINKLHALAPITALHAEQLQTISDTTAESCSEELGITSFTDAMTSLKEPPKLGMNINGNDYVLGDETLTDCLEICTKFQAHPYKRQLQQLLRITNIGKETLSFYWKQGIYYNNSASLLLSQDREFLFDLRSFRLVAGETYNLMVLYQPRKVRISVELWYLEVEPKIFCCKEETLQLRLFGVCQAPNEYLDKINEMRNMALWKLNYEEMQIIPTNVAAITPLLAPTEAMCPYERVLDEREIFNAQNPGYNCLRYDDLEVLKSMHMQLKKPREPPWDLQLATIKTFIMRMERFDEREKMFAHFMKMLATLQGAAPSLEDLRESADRERTRFIYVRGIICNGLEDWETLIYTIEETYLKPEMQRYRVALKMQQQQQDLDVANSDVRATGDAKYLDDEQLKAIVLKKLHHCKYYRDALYIQTYTHVCDIIENIVSVIESTI